MEQDILEEINKKYTSMSKSQRQIATFITAHYDKAAYLPAKKLAAQIGISESTVVRFAAFMGFPGYNEFQEAIAKRITTKLGFEEDEKGSHAPEKVFDYELRKKNNTLAGGVLSRDIMNIEQTLRDLNPKAFENAATILYEARTVYIIGLRTCLPLAQLLGFYLSTLRPNVVIVGSTDLSETFEKLVHASSQDVVVGISFPNYSMRTLRAMEFANERKARLIAITDSIYSPMILYSSCNLYAKTEGGGMIDSMAAPLSLINALIVQTAEKYKKTYNEKMKILSEAWDNYQCYDADAIGAKYYYDEDAVEQEENSMTQPSEEKKEMSAQEKREEVIEGQMELTNLLKSMEDSNG